MADPNKINELSLVDANIPKAQRSPGTTLLNYNFPNKMLSSDTLHYNILNWGKSVFTQFPRINKLSA